MDSKMASGTILNISPSIAEKLLFHIHKVHPCPQISIEELKNVIVPYLDFKGKKKQGSLIVNASIAKEVVEIFQDLFQAKFPIEKIKLIEEYDASDCASMEDNNSSAFCYREAVGKPGVLSKHSLGLAIDINPLYNPYVKGSLVLPKNGEKFLDRSLLHPGMISQKSPCYEAFIKRGWTWGGSWPDRQDYHHFEK